MITNGKLHGFLFEGSERIEEISATLHRARHEKSGATLLFLEREDDNKTFAISFKTIPEDDTGVFHIIEHSVLCGSRKFPVKEPFVDLLKSSVKTFLNAFTFPDKTMYPVSSRCDKDFYNLVDVYMDAVLHPLALEKPEIFMQEGWHYELHEGDTEMSYKGVVFNEMKGAYSSADEIECEYMTKLLYPDVTYGKDSGGNPAYIPSLTYEGFVNAHKKYYSPENATVILDGSIDLDKTLELLDGYLSEYEAQGISFEIETQGDVGEVALEEFYEISDGESEEGKTRLSLGFRAHPYYAKREAMALSLAIDAIAGSNESPFKKAMLEDSLLEDVYFSPYDGIKDSSLILTMKNIKKENAEALKARALSLIEKTVREGIDKDSLAASLGRLEFKIREQDGAGYPLGIAYAIALMEFELYGGNPADGLRFEENLRFLREEGLNSGYCEEILKRVILDAKSRATLTLIPKATLGEERRRAEEEHLKKVLDSFTEAQRLEVIEKTRRLEEWQTSEDTPEAKATIPKLKLGDISSKPEELSIIDYKDGDNTVVYSNVASRGISYITLIFDASDLSGEELFYLSLIGELTENLNTKSYRASELQNKLKSAFGSFSASVFATGSRGKAKTYFRIAFATLDTKKSESAPLLEELLYTSDFSAYDSIAKIIKQLYISAKESFSTMGHVIALNRAAAYISAESAANEYIDGLEGYYLIKKLDSEFVGNEGRLEATLKGLRDRIFVRERATLFQAGREDKSFAANLLSILKSGSAAGDFAIAPLGIRNEGISIPARISYAVSVLPAELSGAKPHGSYLVARNLLSYGYLWNEIRVRGGAYGAGFVARPNATVGFYSYRDPSPLRSVDIYQGTAAYLREYSASGEDLTDCIISAVGDSDPIFTPKVAAATAFASYLRGESYSDRLRQREELLSTTHADLVKIADTLQMTDKSPAICVIGEKEKLLAFGEKLGKIIEL